MQQQQQQLNINPDDLTDITCSNKEHNPDWPTSSAECGSINFRQVYQMKKLSALMSPSGQEQVVTLPVFICDKCGAELSELKQS